MIPTNPDDKDMYVYPSCAAGSPLASSAGTDGIDFVVGDFNHTLLGSYYPFVTYGDLTAYHDVYWRDGGLIFPVGSWVQANLGGTGAGCDMIQIYDVKLEQDREYRIQFDPAMGPLANAALFRNPSTEAYWAGRFASELEISTSHTAYYVAPATDWYGLVVFPIWNTSTPTPFRVTVEALGDCIFLEPSACMNNRLYSSATGPANDYTIAQEVNYWSAVAVVPDTLDEKTLSMFTECDRNGAYLAASHLETTGGTEFIVGDFNHTPLGPYHPRVDDGDNSADFTIQWDSGADIFPVPGVIMGTMDGLDDGCKLIQVWDVFLEAGVDYEFFFYEWGQKDPALALFRNPGTGEFWGGRQDSEWELPSSSYKTYTAPQSDWYGLVVFAGSRKPHTSFYQVQIQPLNDCEPLASGVRAIREGFPRDFSYSHTNEYWSVVGMCPSKGDSKNLYVFTQCDAKGTNLAYSPATGTSFIVGDFNHNTLGTYYPTVATGDPYALYTVECDTDADIFPFDTTVEESYLADSDEGDLIKVWDVFLENGKTYQIGFTRGGAADTRLALFKNPGNGTYWTDRYMAEWELFDSGNKSYTATVSDWYGLVAFANVREKDGNYSIRISEEGATAVRPDPAIPKEFALYQNAPNPFNPSTAIRYDVPVGGGHVSLTVYDVNGRLVRSLESRVDTPGEKTVTWDARDNNGVPVSSGVYFYRLVAQGVTETRKMVVMK